MSIYDFVVGLEDVEVGELASVVGAGYHFCCHCDCDDEFAWVKDDMIRILVWFYKTMRFNCSIGESELNTLVLWDVLGDETCPSISRDRTGFISILTRHLIQGAFPARVKITAKMHIAQFVWHILFGWWYNMRRVCLVCDVCICCLHADGQSEGMQTCWLFVSVFPLLSPVYPTGWTYLGKP